MSSLRLLKINGRDLTPEEEKEIAAWWPVNQSATLDDLIAHFEAKFNTTITRTRVMRIMLEAEGF
jgi:hypothetical protein